MKLFGKTIHGRRIRWWLIIWMTRLFGRRVEVEGSSKRRKILPWIWNGRLHLFGMQHFRAKLVFDSKYRTRIVESPLVEPVLGNSARTPDPDAPPEFLHAVLIHYRPEETNALVAAWADLAGGDDRLFVGYGGPEKHFESIGHPHKAFIPQDQIWVDQPGGTHSYTDFLLKAAEYCIATGKAGVLVTDADAWPCSADYLSTLCLPPWKAGCDFSATRLRDVTNTSFMFPESATHTLPTLERWVREHGLADPNAEVRVLHHFAPLMYFSREILIAMRKHCGNEPPSHVEKTLGSYALHLGASYCAYEDFKVFDLPAWLRYRPNLDHGELCRALDESVPLVHPVKNNGWVSEYARVRERAAAPAEA